MRAFKRKTSFKRLKLLKRLNGLQTNETDIWAHESNSEWNLIFYELSQI